MAYAAIIELTVQLLFSPWTPLRDGCDYAFAYQRCFYIKVYEKHKNIPVFQALYKKFKELKVFFTILILIVLYLTVLC